MGDAIWSTPPGDMLDYPAKTFLRFCDNHGLLHISGKPQWLSLVGGARTYVDAASRAFTGEVFDNEAVERVERAGAGVRVSTARRSENYDAVVIAAHPPQTREMLAETMTDDEREILGAFDYWPNDVVIHTDTSFMPSARKAWASWNWYSATGDIEKAMLMLTYNLNTLQTLPSNAPTTMETLNRDRNPAPGTLLASMVFDHPMYSREAVGAQSRLSSIQGDGNVYYAGAWTRYGFHEDGMLSAVRVAELLDVTIPWGDQLDDSRTHALPGAPIPLLNQKRSLLPTEQPEPLPRAAAVGQAPETETPA
jgi:predicted NAD/FAD-binding protein